MGWTFEKNENVVQCSGLLTCFLVWGKLSNVYDFVWIICGVGWLELNLQIGS